MIKEEPLFKKLLAPFMILAVLFTFAFAVLLMFESYHKKEKEIVVIQKRETELEKKKLLAGLIEVSLGKKRQSNKAMIESFNIGISRDEVLDSLGRNDIVMSGYKSKVIIYQPWRTAKIESADGTYTEVFYYYTDNNHEDGFVHWDDLTPVVVADGKLAGWGSNSVNKIFESY